MKIKTYFNWLIKIILLLLSIIIIAMFSGCRLFESSDSNSNQSNNFGNSYGNSETINNGGAIDSNYNKPQSRTVTIYKQSSDYKPTGTVDEQLITSKLLIDLTGVLGANFKGNLKLDFKVDLAYSKDFTSPSPMFTFFYYSQNELDANYLLGQNTVTILSKTKKTYTFTINCFLEGTVIYGARSCNMDMGYDGNNLLGMYLDYRTFSLNNYFVTVTVM